MAPLHGPRLGHVTAREIVPHALTYWFERFSRPIVVAGP
jgi:hypothetical protein